MATNVYFSAKHRPEQNLYEDLVIESLKMYGQDVMYMPRTSVTVDEILNEDYARFEDAYNIEMYIETVDGFAGEGDLLAKFGAEIRDQATFIVSKRRWEHLVGVWNNDIEIVRPQEGDLIYLPLSNSLFEIRFVEHEQPFYQLSNLPVYKLNCELFEYSNEDIDTGYEEVDVFERTEALNYIELNMVSGAVAVAAVGAPSANADDADVDAINGTGINFIPGEVVTQRVLSGGGIVTIQGEVADFDRTGAGTGVLKIIHDSGVVDWTGGAESHAIYGVDSEAAWMVETIVGVEFQQVADNNELEYTADDIIDFSETNPFGEPGNIGGHV